MHCLSVRWPARGATRIYSIFCKFLHPDRRGIPETPVKAEAEVRPIVVWQPPDAPYPLLVDVIRANAP
jgi:hypothetical protein